MTKATECMISRRPPIACASGVLAGTSWWTLNPHSSARTSAEWSCPKLDDIWSRWHQQRPEHLSLIALYLVGSLKVHKNQVWTRHRGSCNTSHSLFWFNLLERRFEMDFYGDVHQPRYYFPRHLPSLERVPLEAICCWALAARWADSACWDLSRASPMDQPEPANPPQPARTTTTSTFGSLSWQPQHGRPHHFPMSSTVLHTRVFTVLEVPASAPCFFHPTLHLPKLPMMPIKPIPKSII